jgi:hypothetical protein
MFAFLLLACVTAESYPTQSASVVCARFAECEKADFESAYDDPQDCKDDYEALVQCLSDECDFDAKAAGEALSAVRSADCDDVGEASGNLGDAYTDCDELAVATCIF